MLTEDSGTLSNGMVWTWCFGGRVDLLTPDRTTCVMVTYLNSRDDTLPFEDDVWDKEFDPTFTNRENKKLRREYDSVCWKCYTLECKILNKIFGYVKDWGRIGVKCLQNKADPTEKKRINSEQFAKMVANIIDVIRVKEEIGGDEEWRLLGHSGVITEIVDEELEDYLTACGYELD